MILYQQNKKKPLATKEYPLPKHNLATGEPLELPWQKAKEYLKHPETLRNYLEKTDRLIGPNRMRCWMPGHEDHFPSASFYSDTSTCYCHTCAKHGDIFDLAEVDCGITNFNEKMKYLSSLYNLKIIDKK